MDSINLIPGKLGEILQSYNCNIKKGYYPYKFVNKDNLFYIGNKPSKEFYSEISDQEYLNIPKNDWNLQVETFKYLSSDIEGLLEVITIFRDNIFNKYQLDITRIKTLPGLALAVYMTSYIPDHLRSELKMVKGELEAEIRSAYFGGNVEVFINKISTGFLYDLNAQYPTAMLNDMPIGEPLLSLETNLENIFGFVYGEITAPNENILQVPFIQYNDPFGEMASCPRGKFRRLIFSEEAKYFALHP